MNIMEAGVAILLCTGIAVVSILVFWLLSLLSNKKIKLAKYRTFSYVLLIFGITLFIFDIFILLDTKFASTDDYDYESSADGFLISSYNVVLDVCEDNVVKVTEEIEVNFVETGHHGIYKFIPEWLEYTGKDGKTVSRQAAISNLEAIGEEYSLDTVSRKERIKIGSEDSTLPIGRKTYTITYDYDMGDDPYEDFDEFIFHAYGDYWGTRINNATIVVKMPKEFEEGNVKFFTDKYRTNDITSSVNYYVLDNVLYAELASDYKLYSSLTVDIELPDGYFASGNTNYGYGSLLFIIVIIIFTIISYFMWLRYGKDFNTGVETVEFYPPEGYDVASIGYIYKSDTGRKLAISTILELASKGYIKIDETEDKKTRTIINLCDDKSELSVDDLTINQKIVFEQLFAKDNEVDLSKDKNFYKVFEKLTKSLAEELDDKINDIESYKKMSIVSSLCYLGTIYWGYAFLLEDLNPTFNFLYYLSLIAVLVMIILTFLMTRKNIYGETILAKINGFKNYLITAEKEKIEALVAENPNYFYDILPYAYALDVSKKWVERFENIPVPDHDMGTFSYTDNTAFIMLSHDSTYAVSGSSGSSSCGGGCSSCGGGCSSCGGGGSW